MHKLNNFKKYYFINQFRPDHLIKLDKNISLIWRSKYKDDNQDLIVKFANFCKKNQRSFYIANDFKLAIKLRATGVYISANNRNIVPGYSDLFKNLQIVGSAHNLKEIQIKKKQKVKEIFLSPIFKKKHNKPIGLYKLKHLFDNFKYGKIALGGINSKNIKLLKMVKFRGFAAINYFE